MKIERHFDWEMKFPPRKVAFVLLRRSW